MIVCRGCGRSEDCSNKQQYARIHNWARRYNGSGSDAGVWYLCRDCRPKNGHLRRVLAGVSSPTGERGGGPGPVTPDSTHPVDISDRLRAWTMKGVLRDPGLAVAEMTEAAHRIDHLAGQLRDMERRLETQKRNAQRARRKAAEKDDMVRAMAAKRREVDQ